MPRVPRSVDARGAEAAAIGGVQDQRIEQPPTAADASGKGVHRGAVIRRKRGGACPVAGAAVAQRAGKPEAASGVTFPRVLQVEAIGTVERSVGDARAGGA